MFAATSAVPTTSWRSGTTATMASHRPTPSRVTASSGTCSPSTGESLRLASRHDNIAVTDTQAQQSKQQSKVQTSLRRKDLAVSCCKVLPVVGTEEPYRNDANDTRPRLSNFANAVYAIMTDIATNPTKPTLEHATNVQHSTRADRAQRQGAEANGRRGVLVVACQQHATQPCRCPHLRLQEDGPKHPIVHVNVKPGGVHHTYASDCSGSPMRYGTNPRCPQAASHRFSSLPSTMCGYGWSASDRTSSCARRSGSLMACCVPLCCRVSARQNSSSPTNVVHTTSTRQLVALERTAVQYQTTC